MFQVFCTGQRCPEIISGKNFCPIATSPEAKFVTARNLDHLIRIWKSNSIAVTAFLTSVGPCRAGCFRLADAITSDLIFSEIVNVLVLLELRKKINSKWFQDKIKELILVP